MQSLCCLSGVRLPGSVCRGLGTLQSCCTATIYRDDLCHDRRLWVLIWKAASCVDGGAASPSLAKIPALCSSQHHVTWSHVRHFATLNDGQHKPLASKPITSATMLSGSSSAVLDMGVALIGIRLNLCTRWLCCDTALSGRKWRRRIPWSKLPACIHEPSGVELTPLLLPRADLFWEGTHVYVTHVIY